jgi:dihydroxy-acid dehydratase
MISLDVPGRRLDLDVPAEELRRRRPSKAAEAAHSSPLRGWQKLYVDHVMQADRGVDLDFLVGSSGDTVTRDSH